MSTDEQSTQRQTHLLAEAGLADGAEGVRLFAEPPTSSTIPALQRTRFRELASYARRSPSTPTRYTSRRCST